MSEAELETSIGRHHHEPIATALEKEQREAAVIRGDLTYLWSGSCFFHHALEIALPKPLDRNMVHRPRVVGRSARRWLCSSLLSVRSRKGFLFVESGSK